MKLLKTVTALGLSVVIGSVLFGTTTLAANNSNCLNVRTYGDHYYDHRYYYGQCTVYNNPTEEYHVVSRQDGAVKYEIVEVQQYTIWKTVTGECVCGAQKRLPNADTIIGGGLKTTNTGKYVVLGR